MYNLHLSPEQLQIRDTVRDFVVEVIKPLALKPERLEARARPLLVQALDKAAQMGLRTLALSEDCGGAGADNLTCCIVTEELAAGDPDVAAVLAQTSTLAQALFDRLMAAEQRARFLPAFLADQRYHLALAEHEADRDAALGINYHRPQTSHAPFKTAAVRAGDGWVVNGRKDRVVGASLAALFAVRARAAIWQAAWASDHPDAFADRSLPDLPLTSIAAVFASEAIYRAAKDAAECFGAMGVMRDMPLQQYVHDALVCLHSGDGNTDAKLRIAEALARYRRPASAAVLAAE